MTLRTNLLLSAFIILNLLPNAQLGQEDDASDSDSNSDSDSSSSSDNGEEELSSSSSDSDDDQSSEYDKETKCNQGLLNAYSIDGLDRASARPMELCPEVKYSCCSPLDELRHHKNWFSFYKPKMGLNLQRKMERLDLIRETLEFFNNFKIEDYKDLVMQGAMPSLKELLGRMNGGIDPELRPVFDELENVHKKDLKVKRGVFCVLCDFSNHEYFSLSGSTLLVNQKQCQDIIEDYGLMMKINSKLLHPQMLKIHKLTSYFALNYYNRDDWDLVSRVREADGMADKCFPTENTEFSLERCREVCNKYNFMDQPGVFFGDYEFYDYFLGKVGRFRKWLEHAKEDPKKYLVRLEGVVGPVEGTGSGEAAKETDAGTPAETPANDEGKERILEKVDGKEREMLGRQDGKSVVGNLTEGPRGHYQTDKGIGSNENQIKFENRSGMDKGRILEIIRVGKGRRRNMRIKRIQRKQKRAQRKSRKLKMLEKGQNTDKESRKIRNRVKRVERKLRKYRQKIKRMKESNMKFLKRQFRKTKQMIAREKRRKERESIRSDLRKEQMFGRGISR